MSYSEDFQAGTKWEQTLTKQSKLTSKEEEDDWGDLGVTILETMSRR
jgi:hypothetical protein